MQVYLITSTGENGPFTVDQINKKFFKRQITGEHLCRLEDTNDIRRLDEIFRHMKQTRSNYVAPMKKTEISPFLVIISAISGSIYLFSQPILLTFFGISEFNRKPVAALIAVLCWTLLYLIGKLFKKILKP